MELTELQEIYSAYEEALGKARRKATLFSGLFGQGSLDDPRGNPCNQEFYEKTGAWVEAFAATDAPEDRTLAVCRFILNGALDPKAPTYWYCLVAQGYVEKLIPKLSAQSCALLQAEYDKHYPRKKRLPIQEQLYKHLSEKAGNGDQK